LYMDPWKYKKILPHYICIWTPENTKRFYHTIWTPENTKRFLLNYSYSMFSILYYKYNQVIVCFVDIGGIVDHHCLNFFS
jgi:hypothetical protein